MNIAGAAGGGRDWDFAFALDPPGPTMLADLRTWLRLIFGDLGADVVVDLELVCTELVTNALEHAASPRCLRLRRDKGTNVVRIEVDDASPDLLPTVGVSRLSQRSGRGLQLVGALAHWGTRCGQHSKTLWAELPVS